MAKDPAFLFYSSDFMSGVSGLTMEERGQYITILCLQHQLGHLNEKTIRLTVGSVSVDVLQKLEKDENGFYFNKRLEEEIEKRLKFTDSRRSNGSKGGRKKASEEPNGYPNGLPEGKATENHTDNENENIIKIENPIGSENVKKFANEAWNDKTWVEQICMANYLEPSILTRWMAGYNASLSNDTIPNFTVNTYKKMFGGWLKTQISKGYKVEQVKQVKQVDTLKKL